MRVLVPPIGLVGFCTESWPRVNLSSLCDRFVTNFSRKESIPRTSVASCVQGKSSWRWTASVSQTSPMASRSSDSARRTRIPNQTS